MDKVALLSAKQRNELFEASAFKKGILPALIEKDFWVCWALKQLFDSDDLSKQLVFKGGTSLSKVYGIIDRFSEDIDLVLDWRVLGYGSKGDDPWEEKPSRSQRDTFNNQFNERAKDHIKNALFPNVSQLLSKCPEITLEIPATDGHIIDIHYPAAFKAASLRPQILLEIGPLASWVPSQRSEIMPYAAACFPEVFDDSKCSVVAIKAERTFWEKATILHQQAHRPTAMLPNYSRHYYDLFQLSKSLIKDDALADLTLLEEVVIFKDRFYPSAWARYDLAKPGSFRLLPTEQGHKELRNDYGEMQDMIFGVKPSWDEIIKGLRTLEAEINSLAK